MRSSERRLVVACITDNIREATLRWYGHVMRRKDENSTKRIMTAEVNGRAVEDDRRSDGETSYSKT